MNPPVITQKLLDHYQAVVPRENQAHQERLQLRAPHHPPRPGRRGPSSGGGCTTGWSKSSPSP